MNMKISLKVLLATALGLTAMTQAAVAREASLPAYYPEQFSWVVPIDQVNYRQRSLIVGDVEVGLDENVVIHTPEKENDTIFSLRPGRFVGFVGAADGAAVKELWVIPAATIRKMHKE